MVQSRDAFGNACVEGGAAVRAQLKSGSATVDARVRDHNDGTYSVEVVPETAGEHALQVFVSDEAVPCSATQVIVLPGASFHHRLGRQMT